MLLGMQRAPGSALVALLLGLLFPSTATASDILSHKVVMLRALRPMGWDAAAMRDAVNVNVATDLARLPTLAHTVTRVAWPATYTRLDPVSRLCETASFSPRSSVGFHFNSLYRFDDIARRWADLDGWVDGQCRHLAARGVPKEDYRLLVGVVAHCVQDFYEHANWIGIIDRFATRELKPGDYPLWEELMEGTREWPAKDPGFDADAARNRMRASNARISDREELGGLQTGRIRAEVVPPGTVAPWMHRHYLGDQRWIVRDLGVRAVTRWTRLIDLRLDAASRPSGTAIGLPGQQ